MRPLRIYIYWHAPTYPPGSTHRFRPYVFAMWGDWSFEWARWLGPQWCAPLWFNRLVRRVARANARPEGRA